MRDSILKQTASNYSGNCSYSNFFECFMFTANIVCEVFTANRYAKYTILFHDFL